MTDQEIRCVILKAAYDAKKADTVAMAPLSRISVECGVEYERVLSNFRYLEKKGLVKCAVSGKVVSVTDIEITEKEIGEYKEKCRGNKGD